MDPWPRVAWLLATTRLLHPHDPGRSAFVASLREQGITADLSRVSRWESGVVPIPGRVVLAYESVLERPSGSLLAVTRELQRTSSLRSSRVESSAYTDDARDGGLDFETLLELAVGPRPQLGGGDWLRLAVELSRYESVFIPRTSWRLLCSRLIDELARTTGLDQLRRYEAAVVLTQHPHSQQHVIRSLGEWLTRSDVQLVSPMLSLLQEIDVEAASLLAVRLLDSEVPAIRDHALTVAAAKLARGHLDPSTIGRVERHGLRHIVDTLHPMRVQNGLDVAAHLPQRAFDSVVQAVQDRLVRSRAELAREHSELIPTKLGRALARAVSIRAQRPFQHSGGEADRMLEHLVHEVLCHVHEPRRAAAAHLLAASPYARTLETALLSLTIDERDLVAIRAWDALLAMGHCSYPEVVADRVITERRPAVAAAALAALRGCSSPLEERHSTAVARVAAEGGIDERPHAVAALGLRAPVILEGLTTEDPQVVRAVRWWRDVGPALLDVDTAASLSA